MNLFRITINAVGSTWLAILMLGVSGSVTRARAEAVADIMVGYSATWRAGMGGTDQTNAAIYNQHAGANNIAAASGSPHRMNVVGTKESAHDPTNEVDCGAMIGWLRDYNVNIRDVADMGNALGADLFTYIGDMANNGAAAQAAQPGRFSCYEQQWFWQNVVAHEAGGHNYGCDHAVGHNNPTTIMLHNYCGGSQPFYSNPNIWLNGVKLLGDGSCIGYLAQGGDAAYLLSNAAQGRADIADRTAWGSNLYPIVRRWQFNTAAGPAPAGTVIADSVGGAQATVRGVGATFTGTGLRLPGGTTGNTAADSIAVYIDLPNGIFSALPNFTIEVWATPRAGSAWARVMEFGRTVEAGDGLGAAGEWTGTPGSAAPGATSASDVIGLSFSRSSGNLGGQRFIAGLDGATQLADSDVATTAGEMHHYAITFTDATASGAGGTVKWFRDGALIKTLNVTFDSASLEDVNIWLGRSLWSSDTMGQIDYHDVRIIGRALADGEIAGNYRIGPHDAVATMWARDAYNSSGFVSGAWEFGGTPVPTRDYEVGTLRLRTPRNGSNVTWPGKSLRITGGELNMDATGTRTVTINDLRLNGGATIGAYTSAGTQTLAGTITAKNFTDNTIRGNTGLVVSANITGGVGGGGITYVESGTTLTGNNTGYLGATIIGDGRFSTLKIASETNLGGNPTFYGGAWLQLNRGILETTQTMTIDDANRGVLVGPSGGFFRPAAGTTLTIATTINSPAAGNTLQTAPMDSNPILGIFFKDGAGTLVLTNPNNSHNAEMQILQGELRLNGAARLNNGDHWMPITLNSTLNYNSTANQTLRGALSGNGALVKNSTGTLNINGSNPFTGSVTVNAGTLYANPGNGATNRAFSFVSGITVNSGATLRAGINGLFGWDGTQARPITINTGGTLTTDAANADVNVGTITLNGGTLAGFSSPAWGSWSFKRAANAKLIVTDNSTVSAPNVSLGANNAIDVAAGKTLAFSGTITDLTSEGVCALVKSGGVGTLLLSGTNTFTGATSLNTGTTIVNGSLAAGSAVTVAGGATLAGTGTIGGALTFAANAIHAPGNLTGVQTVGGALSYGSGARLKWMLNANADASSARNQVAAGSVTVTSGAVVDLTFNSASSSVNFSDVYWTSNRSWPVLTSSSLSGAFALGTITPDAGGRIYSNYGSFVLSHSNAGATLQWTPKPFHKWRGTALGALASNETLAAFQSDPDGDQLANGVEYFQSSNPLASTVTSLQSQLVNGRAVLRFDRNTEATDVVAVVQGADGIKGQWVELARSTAGSPFVVVLNGASVTELGSGTTRSVEFTDAYLTTDPAHSARVFRLVISDQ